MESKYLTLPNYFDVLGHQFYPNVNAEVIRKARITLLTGQILNLSPQDYSYQKARFLESDSPEVNDNERSSDSYIPFYQINE